VGVICVSAARVVRARLRTVIDRHRGGAVFFDEGEEVSEPLLPTLLSRIPGPTGQGLEPSCAILGQSAGLVMRSLIRHPRSQPDPFLDVGLWYPGVALASRNSEQRTKAPSH
jgi:hypothetical protein